MKVPNSILSLRTLDDAEIDFDLRTSQVQGHMEPLMAFMMRVTSPMKQLDCRDWSIQMRCYCECPDAFALERLLRAWRDDIVEALIANFVNPKLAGLNF